MVQDVMVIRERRADKAVTAYTRLDRITEQLNSVDMGRFDIHCDLLLALAKKHSNSLLNGSQDLLRFGFLQGQRSAEARRRKAVKMEAQEFTQLMELYRDHCYQEGIREGWRQANNFHSGGACEPPTVDTHYIDDTGMPLWSAQSHAEAPKGV